MDLSIIIPVYNAEKYLEKCLLSIQNQLLQNFEVIMVNDGSLDNSEIICRNFAKKDKRFRLLTIENSGPAHARNVGIAAARGEFIGFVDSDDFIEPEMYESLMQYAQSFPVDMVIGGLRYIDENGQIIKEMKMDIPFGKVMNKKEIEENLLKKYYGNNNNGELELYLKTGADKVSVFISNLKISKKEYLKLTEKEARKIKFIYDREVNELQLDVVAVVLRTSDINIPAGRYTLSTLDKLTKEQDLEEREETELSDGIAYIIVDNNTACTLYDDTYLFSKDGGGLIASLKERIKSEKNDLIRDNLKLILNYYDETNEKVL